MTEEDPTAIEPDELGSDALMTDEALAKAKAESAAAQAQEDEAERAEGEHPVAPDEPGESEAE
jgi:hypothetical protein